MQSFQLRNALVPYIYTAARTAYATGILLVHPLYYEWPDLDAAYSFSQLRGPGIPIQHMYFALIKYPGPFFWFPHIVFCRFGNSFTVAPITNASDASTGLVSWTMWVPPGVWVDWWTGKAIQGPCTYDRLYGASETPLLARAGAIIPMKTYADARSVAPASLKFTVVWAGAGSVGEGWVYEDNGSSLGYTTGMYLMMRAQLTSSSAAAVVVLQPAVDGKGYTDAPLSREYQLVVRAAPASLHNVTCDGCAPHWMWHTEFQEGLFLLILDTGVIGSRDRCNISWQYS